MLKSLKEVSLRGTDQRAPIRNLSETTERCSNWLWLRSGDSGNVTTSHPCMITPVGAPWKNYINIKALKQLMTQGSSLMLRMTCAVSFAILHKLSKSTIP